MNHSTFCGKGKIYESGKSPITKYCRTVPFTGVEWKYIFFQVKTTETSLLSDQKLFSNRIEKDFRGKHFQEHKFLQSPLKWPWGSFNAFLGKFIDNL